MGPSLRVACVLSLASGILGSCIRTPGPSPVSPDSHSAPSVWTADFVYLKAGERERYFRFLEANWAQARATALSRGLIRSYRILAAPDTTSGWQVMLLTEYPDASAFERREAIFRPILEARGRILIDGKGTRELTDSIVNRRVENFLGAP